MTINKTGFIKKKKIPKKYSVPGTDNISNPQCPKG